jgi:hypothetical protein
MKTPILAFLCALSTAFLASGQVPSLINYQGRLTDANGAAVTGSKNFSIDIFDAATGGNLLYSETIGAVTLDSNGVYSFHFGSAGTSNKQVTETIGTTAGTTLVYSKALANSSVVNNSITVTDGTNSWSQSVGNPGAGATATANTIVGFVIGATITNGGSGYTSAPTVTISGNGTGAAATATLTDGVVTGINVTSAGSGYTTGATITIAPPVIPFRVEYSSGTITATYASAPTAGQTIAATYRYGTGGIADALGNASEHWMAITVDGVTQGTRQRVLAVPFAQRAAVADSVKSVSDSALLVGTKDLEARIDNLLQLEGSRLITGTGQSLISNAQVERFGSATPNGQYGKLISTNSSIGAKGVEINKKVILGTTTGGSAGYTVNDLAKFVHLYHPGVGGRTITTTLYYDDDTTHTNIETRWINEGGGQFRTLNPFPGKVLRSVSFSGMDYWNTGMSAEMHYRSLSPVFVNISMNFTAEGGSRLTIASYVADSEGYTVMYEAYQADGSLTYSGSQPSFTVPLGKTVSKFKMIISPPVNASLLEGAILQGVYVYKF